MNNKVLEELCLKEVERLAEKPLSSIPAKEMIKKISMMLIISTSSEDDIINKSRRLKKVGESLSGIDTKDVGETIIKQVDNLMDGLKTNI